jgi:HTH-type transcriptional regulator/antitoxin HipB
LIHNKFPIRKFLLVAWDKSVYLADREARMTNTMTPVTFGKAVRTARKAQGLRQDQLAGAAGVGVRFVIELEAGKASVHLGKALAVAAALGLQMDLTGPAS